MGEPARLAELIGGLSLATDLAAGLALESAVRSCLVAVRLGGALSVQGFELQDVYYVGLLRFIGCTAYAHEMARDIANGDDLALLGAWAPVDTRDRRRCDQDGGQDGAAAPGRWRAIAKIATDPKGPDRLFTSHCDLAVMLAERLGMSPRVITSLGQIYERFDGKGAPNRVRGETIELPARILHVAWRAALHRSLGGRAAALAMVEARAAGELDPHLCEGVRRARRRAAAGSRRAVGVGRVPRRRAGAAAARRARSRAGDRRGVRPLRRRQVAVLLGTRRVWRSWRRAWSRACGSRRSCTISGA